MLMRRMPPSLQGCLAPDQGAADILQTARAQYALLRPRPGHWLDGRTAATLARSAAPTLLALDVLEVLVSTG